MSVAALSANAPLPLTRALAAAMSDTLPVPIEQTLDADTADEKFLPFLAANESVKIWYDDWPEERRRLVAKRWLADYASIIGTRAALHPFLALVDATVVDRIASPRRFFFGKSFVGRDPIQHPPFTGRYLVKVALPDRAGAMVMRRSFIGKAFFHRPDIEPIRRANAAMVAAKGPSTQYTVDYAHRRPLRLSDRPVLGTAREPGPKLNSFIDRIAL